jgi:hypothetical protein
MRHSKWRYVVVALLLLSATLANGSAHAARFFEGEARERAFAEVERLRAIQARHLAALHALQGVIGTGIGLDRDAGRLIFDVMIGSDAQAPALPDTLEGVPLRIVRQVRVRPQDSCTAPNTACHADLQTLPVEMGNSAHTGPVSVSGGSLCHMCSLGFKACDLVTRQTVYVTAAHCSKGTASTCAGSAAPSAPTYHRAPGDAASCSLENTIGTIANQQPPVCFANNTVEAASVVSLAGQTQISIRDIGSPSAYPGTVLPGDGVQKSGRTTGYTVGTVTDVSASIVVDDPSTYCNCSGGVTFVDQIRIERAWSGVGFPSPAAVYWTKSGDSGSAVLEQEGSPPAIVGLNFVGSDDHTFGYANPISSVLAALNLSLNLLDCTSPCAATEAAMLMSGPARVLRLTADFRDVVLSKSARGRDYIGIYYRFSGDLVDIMRFRPDLLARTVWHYARNLPVLEQMIAGRAATVDRAQIEAVDELLTGYAESSSNPDLKVALGGLRRDLRDPAVLKAFGISVR